MKKCRIWQQHKDRLGYGRKGYRIDGKFYCGYVHRMEYEKHHGPIPKGVHICHHCDVRACYEITHLYAGNPATNAYDRDSRKRGKWAKGEEHGLSKLQPYQVQDIRRQFAKGTSKSSLARKHNVSHMTVHSIITSRTWKWLKKNDPQ